MTNKTERYFVVSEDQLVVLGIENRNYGFNVSVDQVNDWLARLKKAEAALLDRLEKLEVVAEAAESYLGMWVEKDDPRDRDLRDALAALENREDIKGSVGLEDVD